MEVRTKPFSRETADDHGRVFRRVLLRDIEEQLPRAERFRNPKDVTVFFFRAREGDAYVTFPSPIFFEQILSKKIAPFRLSYPDRDERFPRPEYFSHLSLLFRFLFTDEGLISEASEAGPSSMIRRRKNHYAVFGS
jgi:hypothetical protein